jgi:Zn-dependent oligopeptidase
MLCCAVLCRSLREEVYKAYYTRATEGDLDNTPIIDKVGQVNRHNINASQYDSYFTKHTRAVAKQMKGQAVSH